MAQRGITTGSTAHQDPRVPVSALGVASKAIARGPGTRHVARPSGPLAVLHAGVQSGVSARRTSAQVDDIRRVCGTPLGNRPRNHYPVISESLRWMPGTGGTWISNHVSWVDLRPGGNKLRSRCTEFVTRSSNCASRMRCPGPSFCGACRLVRRQDESAL